MVEVLAHRGASQAAPEKTIEAFHLARAMGSDAVEFDVRRTVDGVLVDGVVVGTRAVEAAESGPAELAGLVALLRSGLDARA